MEVRQMIDVQAGFLREQWKQDGILTLLARLILGAVFIYASIDKIAHPAAFAMDIYHYQILPDALINLTAMGLPWLELITGAFLLTGLFREGSVLIVTGLLVIFLSAMVFNLARGLDIHCGCFHTSADGTDNTPMAWYVFRDGLFLLPALYLFYRTFWGKRETVKVQEPCSADGMFQ
jgi:uncharacterized membrane protein YphA (DoxX/SURF4 family)